MNLAHGHRRKPTASRQWSGSSIAIWGEVEGSNNETSQSNGELQAHFNYWHMASQKSGNGAQDFFDIGIRCVATTPPSALCIYVPFVVKLSEIEDLGPQFRDARLAAGIFNESLAVTTELNTYFIKLTRADRDYVRIFVFNSNDRVIDSDQLTAKNTDDGTLLEITKPALTTGCHNLGNDEALYFRIRLRPQPGRNPFSRIIRPTDAYLLSSFEYSEFLDFRLNEARNLPVQIANRMWKPIDSHRLGNMLITQIHFLVVVGEAATVADGVESNKQRLLENDLWKNYTKNSEGDRSSLCQDMVVHHWTKKVIQGSQTDVGAFSAFMKLRIRRSGGSLVLRYLLVVAIIGCIGSLLANIAWAEWFQRCFVSTSVPITTEAVAKARSKVMVPMESKHATADPRPPSLQTAGGK